MDSLSFASSERIFSLKSSFSSDVVSGKFVWAGFSDDVGISSKTLIFSTANIGFSLISKSFERILIFSFFNELILSSIGEIILFKVAKSVLREVKSSLSIPISLLF